MRQPYPVVLLLVLAALAGCGRSVPPVPLNARGQPAHAAPERPWLAKGRIAIAFVSWRASAQVIIRGEPDGRARLAVVGDEGLLLLDVSVDPAQPGDGWYRIESVVEPVKEAAPHLARIALHAFGLPVEQRRWEDDILVGATRFGDRIYGGDPILLRLVEGQGLTLELEDWRPFDGELAPWSVRALGPLGLTMTIILSEIRHLASPVEGKPR
ncbi:hypothetical protein LBMAG53_35400 [Planctomycetota bacterium]|nr:hypothetical protein LBMAG53_35400 [Planctomycetota bacterium]